jgi:tRNA(Ile)-lysidine synthase
MVSKVEKALSRFCMIVPEDRVLVALSGGGDSVALLYCLLELSKKRDFSLACAHLHHGIRGAEADRDEAFCRELCEKEGLFLAVEHRDIPRLAKERGISQELCGREERYAFFERVCEEYDLTK